MNDKTRKVMKFVQQNAGELVAIAALGYVAYRLKDHRLVPIRGHFISQGDFERLLFGHEDLILMTPRGEFRVTPV